MANDSWDWPAAFERAGKGENLRLAETLKPEDFARALRSMWVEHGMLERSDPRVQEFSRAGRLEWWDGRGRCVVLVREGAHCEGMDPALRAALKEQSLGGLIPKGFAPPLGQPYTHPLPEPDPPPDAVDAMAAAQYAALPPRADLAVEELRPGLLAVTSPAGAPMPTAAEARMVLDAAKPKGKKK